MEKCLPSKRNRAGVLPSALDVMGMNLETERPISAAATVDAGGEQGFRRCGPSRAA